MISHSNRIPQQCTTTTQYLIKPETFIIYIEHIKFRSLNSNSMTTNHFFNYYDLIDCKKYNVLMYRHIMAVYIKTNCV